MHPMAHVLSDLSLKKARPRSHDLCDHRQLHGIASPDMIRARKKIIQAVQKGDKK
jgi:hypothetical protein